MEKNYAEEQVIEMNRTVNDRVESIASKIGFMHKGRAGKNTREFCPYHNSRSNDKGDNASYDGKSYICFHADCSFARAFPKGADGVALAGFANGLDPVNKKEDYIPALEAGYNMLGISLPEPAGNNISDEVAKRLNYEKLKQECLNDFMRLCVNNLREGNNQVAIDYLVNTRNLSPQTFFDALYGCTSDDPFWAVNQLKKKYPIDFLKKIKLVNDKGMDFFRGRIMYFEVVQDRFGADFDLDKAKVVGMQGRAYHKVDDKYRFLFPMKEVLANNSLYKWATLRFNAKIVICEGVFDADSFDQAFGSHIATASFGTHGMSDELAADIVRNPMCKEIFLCQDSDETSFAGQISNLQKARFFAENAKDKVVRVIMLPSGKDPNQLIIDGWGQQEFQELLDKALTVEEFEIIIHCQNALRKVQAGNIRSAQFDALRSLNDLLSQLDNRSSQFEKVLATVADLLGVSYASLVATYNITSNKQAIDDVQVACHMYFIKNGKMPIAKDPTKNEPVEIELLELLPEYLKSIPVNSHFYKVMNFNTRETMYKVPRPKVVRYCIDVRSNVVTLPLDEVQN